MVVVLGAIHIAEGTVAHLLDQLPAFQSWVARKLAFALALFSHYPLEYRGIVVFLFLVSLLVALDGVGSGVAGLGGDITVVHGGGGVSVLVVAAALQRLVLLHVRIAHAILLMCLLCSAGEVVVVVVEALLLGMHVGDMGGGLILG